MIRKIIILLSLCCVVLCAFVGYLSYQAEQEVNNAQVPAVETPCVDLIDSKPSATTRIELTEYVPGKFLSYSDKNSDGNWDNVCIPLFAKKQQSIKNGYCAVLVFFNNVPNREELDKLIKGDTGLEINYWPLKQELDVVTHSQLAQKYSGLDFSRSPIAHYGFEAKNPLLGEATLFASAGAGTLAFCVGFLAMVFLGMFTRKRSNPIDAVLKESKPTTNRAGLPDGSNIAETAGSIFDEADSGSILDQVTSLRG